MEITIIPKWLIKYVSSDFESQYDVNIILSNILIIGLFIIWGDKLLVLANKLPHFCLFDKVVGVQCPVCGVTRAFCKLSDGHIAEAGKLNFSVFFIVLFFVVQIPLRFFSLCKPQKRNLIISISKISNWVVLCAIIIIWLINLIC